MCARFKVFEEGKPLIALGPFEYLRQNSAVVKSFPIFGDRVLCIMSRHHVSPLDDSQEGRQGAPLLEHCREQAAAGWPGGPAGGALSRRDSFLTGTRLAQVDRGPWRDRSD